MKKHILFLMTSFLPLTTFAAPNDAYDMLYPTYAEACTGSQQKPYDDKPGGIAGHIALYLKGACRDTSAEFPQLKMCDPQDTEGGVGVSVDAVYDNVNWVAIDSRELFLNGGLPVDAPLNKDVMNAVAKKAYDRGIFKNVRTKAQYVGPNADHEKWLSYEGIGTDFALTFHRNLRCAKIPVPADRMANMVKYLNSLNEEIYKSGKSYNWSMLANNCAHVVHNAFAAAGMWDFKKVDQSGINKLSNISIPPNEWVQTERFGNRALYDPIMLYHDSWQKKLLLSGWIPAQHGSLVETFSVHKFENSIANPDTDFFIVDIPKIGFYNVKANEYLNQPEFTDVKTNLLKYKEIYERALKVRLKAGDPRSHGYTYELQSSQDFQNFYAVYLNYMQKQLDDVNAKLEILANSN